MKRRSTNVSSASWIDGYASVASAEGARARAVRDDVAASVARLRSRVDAVPVSRLLPVAATGRVPSLIVEALRAIARQELVAMEARLVGVGTSLQSIIFHEGVLKETHEAVAGGDGLFRLLESLGSLLRPLAVVERPGPGALKVPLLAFARNGKALVADLARAVLAARASAPHLAGVVHRNLCRAADIDPHDEKRRPPLPDQLSGDARAVALLAFADTPLLDLLLSTVAISIPLETRFEHAHIVARIGWGKSQSLQAMVADFLSWEQVPGLVVIDSQGDMLSKIARLDCFAPGTGRLADRLVIIDPTDVDHPPALNLFAVRHDRLRGMSAGNREMIMNGVIELYETLFGAILGAEVTQKQGVLFRYLARLMLSIPGASLDTLRRVLEEPAPYLANIEGLDGTARDFFLTQFMSRNFAATKEQVLHRLWSVLEQPTFERMFTAPDIKLDLFDALQSGKIVLVNTAKDFLKTERSSILGRLFVALTLQATLERASVSVAQRRPAFLILDEAAEYLDNSVKDLLSRHASSSSASSPPTSIWDSWRRASPKRSPRKRPSSSPVASPIVTRIALARDLRTTPDALLSLEKGSGGAQFMSYVSGLLPTAVPVTLPFGVLEALPRMSDADYARLIEPRTARVTARRLSIVPPPRSAPKLSPLPKAADVDVPHRGRRLVQLRCRRRWSLLIAMVG